MWSKWSKQDDLQKSMLVELSGAPSPLSNGSNLHYATLQQPQYTSDYSDHLKTEMVAYDVGLTTSHVQTTAVYSPPLGMTAIYYGGGGST